MEDGFLRSVRPGPGAPVLSLIIDDIGVYYDAARPSRLEALIAAGEGDTGRARPGIAALRARKLSRYNDAPDLADPPRGHVLVIDQTRGDASIAGAGAGPEDFARMLAAARAEHEGAEIIIRPHPETLSGRKPGHLSAGRGVRLHTAPANPWDMIEGARAVYTVSSQMGFEALMAGRKVRCFGSPFYAGWGATQDEHPAARREARRSVEEIFAAAYLDYPVYFDPWRGGLSDFETALDALTALRDHHRRVEGGAVLSGIRLWKRAQVAKFFAPGGAVEFIDDEARAARRARSSGRRHVVWASKATGMADDPARLEDGFLRSCGLGAALTPPLSLALDQEGIHYDSSRPSGLERAIAAAPSDAAALARAERLREQIIAAGVTKYNLPGAPAPARALGRRVILAAGQVADDASIRLGAGQARTDADLVREIRAAAPDAWIVYKPHPDVEAGLRQGGGAEPLADAVARGVSAAEAIAAADEVWTITSLIGFEALIRGKPVTCLGARSTPVGG